MRKLNSLAELEVDVILVNGSVQHEILREAGETGLVALAELLLRVTQRLVAADEQVSVDHAVVTWFLQGVQTLLNLIDTSAKVDQLQMFEAELSQIR